MKLASLASQYQQAARASHRSVVSILLEAARLRTSYTRLGFSEYIDHQLYESDLSWAQKRAFGGIRMQRILEDIQIDDYSRFISLDKVTMYALLDGYRLPIPPIRASYRSPRPKRYRQLRTADELENYLREPGNLPVYLKRSFGVHGKGNLLVCALNGDELTLGSGDVVPIGTFCQQIDDGRSLGWILQEPLTNHHQIQALTQSDKISGLRVHTFLSGSTSVATKAVFKVNAGRSDSDNFLGGRDGNLVGALDMATGTVLRVVTGTGLDQQANPEHPRSKKRIVGFEIPHWHEVVGLVTDAHLAFPGFICPGWDIAVCEDGPKILEVNTLGDIDITQYAYREPFLDAAMISRLESRNLSELITARPEKSRVSTRNGRAGIRSHHWQW